MKLTKVAQELKDIGGFENYAELTPEQEKLSCCMGSENFGYALEQGYIKPEEWVQGQDLEELKKAIKKVLDFQKVVEELHQEF